MQLDTDERETLLAYVNLDMLGSPNGLRLVYDGEDGGGVPTPDGSTEITELSGACFDEVGESWERTEMGLGSDHTPFGFAGIPIGGLFSGAGDFLSEAQALEHGGEAGQPYDSCYHQACDDLGNIDEVLYASMARAAACTVATLAGPDEIVPP